MNAGNQEIIHIQMDCELVVNKVSTNLRSAGYYVIQSFDLNSALAVRNGQADLMPVCPCQMVVFLVYAKEGPPATLIFERGYSQTMIYLGSDLTSNVQQEWMDRFSNLFAGIFSEADSLVTGEEQ